MDFDLWTHHYSKAYPALVGGDDSKLALRAVYGKSHDGLRWMDRFDAHAAAVSGLPQVVKLERDVYGAQGIEYIPWCVVNGRWPGSADHAEREGMLAADVARAAAGPGERAGIILDLEPHYHAANPNFWRDDLGAGDADVAAFLNAFAAEGGEELWISPDARGRHLEPVRFGRWAASPLVTRVLPQVYWTFFYKGRYGGDPRRVTPAEARGAIDTALATLERYGWRDVAGVHPALPGDSSPEAMVAGIEHAHREGCGGFSVYSRSVLWPDTARAIGELEDPWADSVLADFDDALAALQSVRERMGAGR